MTCTHCGTEVADKALICFRCGRSTADLPAPASVTKRAARKPLWPAVIGLVVLVAAGLFMATATADRIPEWLRWTIAGGAALVLASRLVLRRRR